MTMAENRALLIWIAALTAEAQMIATYGPDGAWLANPTKSFASEKSGMEQTGSLSGGFLGKTMKYY